MTGHCSLFLMMKYHINGRNQLSSLLFRQLNCSGNNFDRDRRIIFLRRKTSFGNRYQVKVKQLLWTKLCLNPWKSGDTKWLCYFFDEKHSFLYKVWGFHSFSLWWKWYIIFENFAQKNILTKEGWSEQFRIM